MDTKDLLELLVKDERRLTALENRIRLIELQLKRNAARASPIVASNNQTKAAHRLHEIAKSTGVSVAFLRKQIREDKLIATKLGSAVVVLDNDLSDWLQGAT